MSANGLSASSLRPHGLAKELLGPAADSPDRVVAQSSISATECVGIGRGDRRRVGRSRRSSPPGCAVARLRCAAVFGFMSLPLVNVGVEERGQRQPLGPLGATSPTLASLRYSTTSSLPSQAAVSPSIACWAMFAALMRSTCALIVLSGFHRHLAEFDSTSLTGLSTNGYAGYPSCRSICLPWPPFQKWFATTARGAFKSFV